MIPAVPAAPPGFVRFTAPPGWPVPAGYDPRRGHLVDPAWPTPPEGGQFWVAEPTTTEPASLPSTRLPRGKLKRRERTRLTVALGVVAVLVALVVWSVVYDARKEDATTEVGACWTAGERVYPVACNSPRAAFVVEQQVSTPDACPASSPGYIEERGDVLCLRPLH